MVDERSSLFTESTAGPSYALPGRTFYQQKRNHALRLQWCICSSFVAVAFILLMLIVIYTSNAIITSESTESTADNETVDKRLNESDFLNLMAKIDWPINDESPTPWLLPPPTELESNAAVNAGINALGTRELFEENLKSVPLNTPSYKHQRAVSTTADARKLTKRGFVENHATHALAKQYSFSKPRGRSTIGNGPELKLDKSSVDQHQCDFNLKFRQPTGVCNNRKEPNKYGVAYTPFRRALNPDYEDGISSPRASHTSIPLPSARQISLWVHRPSYSIDPKFTVMLAVFGQFLDHDITATALNQGQDGEPIDCCVTSSEEHPECFPVRLDAGDPNYDNYGITCMNFIRSAPAPTNRFGPRQQLNQASAFIDGSVIYGSTSKKIEALRTNKNGLLRMYLTLDNRTLLPVSTDPTDGCNEMELNAQGKYCFESGDTRANENLHLTSMHLLWARHHNYVAENLRKINPTWNDERLFQEAKRIVGAQLQHITYNEFLPVILGQNYSKQIGLMPKSHTSDDTYDENIDASIANGFAACAFRFAHTLIPGLMNATKDLNNLAAIELHQMLFNPYSLWANGGLDDAIGGAIRTPLAKSDQYFTTELTEKLFIGLNVSNDRKQSRQNTCGLDLVSLNIQRGRDHGLPAYSEWRKYCNLPSTNTWKKMAFAVDADSLNSLKQVYKDVENVDVYTGALSEPPLDGSIVGPLLSCLITDQFLRLKKGDSHWYERRIGPQKFTDEQLKQIYGTTLASIICRNSDSVTQSSRFVMRKMDAENPIRKCSELDTFKFDAWNDDDENSKNLPSIKVSTAQTNVRVMKKNTETLKETQIGEHLNRKPLN